MLFLRGLILGFSIAAPVGPIGVLCIRRSIKYGWRAGFISGLGAASADMLYGSVAAFSVQAVSDLMIGAQSWLRGIGGLFLIYLGMRTFQKKTAVAAAPEERSSWLVSYTSTFLLTITNPLTILSFAAIFASIAPTNTELTTMKSLQMVAGVFSGSSLWWMILSVTAGWLKSRLSERFNQWIQWVSGMVIVLFGIAAIGSLLH
ncbi:MAG: LysE family translocator [Anaerolineales bacterium]|jgi:threonine/homoserine/homoserine lactone efflux protein